MKAGSKYQPLFDYLAQREGEEIAIRFDEIETILGQALPPSARKRRDWWGNRRQALQASAWMGAGYHVDELDLENSRVVFRKQVPDYEVRREAGIVLWNHAMVKALRLHMGLNQARLANELGVRQQTISEWETGVYAPSRATCKYLTLVAEQAGFTYGGED
ncbi:MAG: helix-turn-helix transcriptional regulator [Anaerolineales bacterium]|nr:helix-turn-helix transcriptional regulator [Anaerolineales bacterium]